MRRRKQQDHGLCPQALVWKPSLGCPLEVREMLMETPVPSVGPGSLSAAENVSGRPGGALAERRPARAPVDPQPERQDRERNVGFALWRPAVPRGRGGFRSLALCPTLSRLLLQPSCFCVRVFVIVFVFLVSRGKSLFPSCFSLKSPRTNESVSWKNLRFPTECANSKESRARNDFGQTWPG